MGEKLSRHFPTGMHVYMAHTCATQETHHNLHDGEQTVQSGAPSHADANDVGRGKLWARH